MTANSKADTYASGNSTPFAYVEIQDLQGALIAFCHADADGRWNVTWQGAIPWFQVRSRVAALRGAASNDSMAVGDPDEGDVRSMDVEAAAQGIHGHTTAGPGRPVTATIGTRRLFAVTGQDGSWTIPINAAMERELGRGVHDVCVSVSDWRGNEAIVWDTVAFG